MAAVTWGRVAQHIQAKLDRARASLDTVADPMEMHRLQGEIRAYKALLNTPEALALVDAEDERVKRERGT